MTDQLLMSAILNTAPRGEAKTILTTDRDLPWEPKGNGFHSAGRAACAQAGASGVTFQDHRGDAARSVHHPIRKFAESASRQSAAVCTARIDGFSPLPGLLVTPLRTLPDAQRCGGDAVVAEADGLVRF